MRTGLTKRRIEEGALEELADDALAGLLPARAVETGFMVVVIVVDLLGAKQGDLNDGLEPEREALGTFAEGRIFEWRLLGAGRRRAVR